MRRDADGFATVGDRGLLGDGRLRRAGPADAVTTGGATVLVADVEAVLRAAATRRGGRARACPHAGARAPSLAVVLTSPADHGPLLAGGPAGARRGAPAPALVPRAELPLTAAGKVDRVALVSLVSGADGRATRLV